ncbi:AMP-binding protein [Xenorhabdus cabanillasii]|uniref:AMP-binding enzyme n=1 Tax=Xenorhabdus cabanillasii JM26 TaxID=1427517 RepID=W1JAK8_9GAMM|nr:AMP-binding protein [Xenorhabdus cabanillasii]PHM75989.1 coronafacic acid synthetase, ligase component [Xenorhabdus cabanillasii JM26]CDL86535.1 putative AMP-binding enzyme [Xenorhabdus cabanillasii JM26]
MKTYPVSQWLSEELPPERIIVWGNHCISLSTFRQDVTALYLRLRNHTASRWALCFDDSYHFCVALLATLHAGKTPVIPGHCREAQLQEQQSCFDGVLTDLPLKLSCPCWHALPHQQDSIAPEAILSKTTLLKTTLSKTIPSKIILPHIASDAALVIFTSGSSGMPKQVIKPVAMMDLEAQWLASLWGNSLQSCVIRASVSHQHLYGLTFRIWLPMSLGLPFERKMVEFPEQFASRSQAPLTHTPLARYALISSPAFLQRLDDTLPAPDCSFVVSAGGPLNFADAERVTQWINTIPNEIYGCTETGIMAWRTRKTDNTVWKAFPGVFFQKDEENNLRVYSPLLSASDGMVLDDQLLFDEQGNFSLLGRRDRLVKIEEKRISLSEIERRLCTIDGIVDAAVLTINRGKRCHIGAVIVLDNETLKHYRQQGNRKFSQDWHRQLKPWLESVALPRYWRVVTAIPLNAQSKRSWPELQELFNEPH